MTRDDVLRQLNARLDAANDEASDMPNGAWQAYMEEAVVKFNEEHGLILDPFTEWIGWVERRQQTI